MEKEKKSRKSYSRKQVLYLIIIFVNVFFWHMSK